MKITVGLKMALLTIMPYPVRRRWKRYRRKGQNFISSRQGAQRVTQEVFLHFLTRKLGIKKADNLIIASSFGNLNAAFTPHELVQLLQKIVSEEGTLVMPYYPPGLSKEWAKSGEVFDMKTTPSSMGILTQVFSEFPGVVKSKHPTKAVVAWGKLAEELTKDHAQTDTPFDWDSPYGKLLKFPSKSVGLGLKNIPIFHSFEDLCENGQYSFYLPNKYDLKIRNYKGTIEVVPVRIHNPRIAYELMPAGDYVKGLGCKTYKRKNIGFAFCYSIDNQDLLFACQEAFKNGHTRYKS